MQVDADRITDSPEQKVNGPFGVMVGVGGDGITFTAIALLGGLGQLDSMQVAV